MYVEMGDLSRARRIFEEITPKKDVSWIVMIAKFSQNDDSEKTLSLFRQMILLPNISTDSHNICIAIG